MNAVQSTQTPAPRPVPGRDRAAAGADTGEQPPRPVRAATPAKPRQQYLDLKASVHRKLLNLLNLEALAIADARRAHGARVTAILPPRAVASPLLSIRRFPAQRLKAAALVGLRALTKPMLDFLTHCVRTRLNTLISGGTGAGKTTLLNVLSG